MMSVQKPLLFITIAMVGMFSQLHYADQTGSVSKKVVVEPFPLKQATSVVREPASEKIQIIENHNGRQNYIIRLKDKPVASYRGGIQGLEATSPAYAKDFQSRKNTLNNAPKAPKTKALKLDLESAAVKSYRAYLKNKQSSFVLNASQNLKFKPDVIKTFDLAFNGMIMNLTQQEATLISAMDEVAFVEQDQIHYVDTYSSTALIGADQVWSGSASPVARQGEGVIVGIIDSGINSDHPSFAAEADDGYVHVNPLGDGNYIGDCETDFPEMCNSKLIGVRSYPTITGVYAADPAVFGDNPPPANGEDYDGHGTHVAGTAVGNTLLNVPLLSPEDTFVESDGINGTGFTFSSLSGVAPRANIIAYQVCYPGAGGDNPDTYRGCLNSVMLSAINDTVADGVDVINMSISGGGNPWNYSIAQAFLSAQEAGIFVAVSGGNSGPEPGTSVKNAPWYTSVAASTSDQTISINSNKRIFNFTGGDTAGPGSISGSAVTQGITAEIVYAGDFPNPNDLPENDPAQCLAPYPEGTFSGQIVLCDRGDIARVQKAANVAAGGAGGFVLSNVDGGATNLASDAYRVPGIHISALDGSRIKNWLATGSGHTATINAASASQVANVADQIAGFSSRGPNGTVPDIMIPFVAAPGVNIYAAFADQQFGHDVTTPTPSDFDFLSGTSMASPHVAGAAALIKSVHPTWSPDNIRSALMMTANNVMTLQGAAGAATTEDMGAGRIQVDLAVNAGLVMEETAANYRAANPDLGGDPKTLNIPSLGNSQCPTQCSWTRTLTATTDATWTVSTETSSADVTFAVTPASFTVTEGETQSIEISATTTNLQSGERGTGNIILTADDPNLPVLKIPAFVTVRSSNLDPVTELEVNRDAGSILLPDNEAIEITDLTVETVGLQKATVEVVQVAEDPTPGDAYDIAAGGVVQTDITLPTASRLLSVDLGNSVANDLDLFVGRDSNGNGVAESGEQLCSSITSTATEECLIEDAEAGDYWILVQSFDSSSEGATDSANLTYAFVPETSLGNFSVTGPTSVPAFELFDLRANWQDEMEVGDIFLGAFELSSNTAEANKGNLGSSVVKLTRGEDDVSLSASAQSLEPGQRVTFTVNVAPNTTPEGIDYDIQANLPAGLELDADSIVASDNSSFAVTTGDGTSISWITSRPAFDPALSTYLQSSSVSDASCQVPNFGQGNAYLNLADFDIAPINFFGDEVATTVNQTFRFLGQTYQSVVLTDNGYVTLGAVVPTSGNQHQKMPSANQPNAVVAPFWRDHILTDEEGSGITLAQAGSWRIIEFDKMRHVESLTNTDVTDTADFQILHNNDTGEIIFAYANVSHASGDALGGSVGWEDSEGVKGDSYIYVGGLYDNALGNEGSITDINDNLVVCYREFIPANQPLTLTFDAVVDGSSAGQSLVAEIVSDVSTVNSRTEVATYSFSVDTALSIEDPGSLSVDEDSSLTIAVNYTDADTNPNTIEVTSNTGTISNLTGNTSGSTFDLTPNPDFVGEITVTVTVTDTVNATNTDTLSYIVTVNPVNDAPTVTSSISSSNNANNVTSLTLTAEGNDIDGDTLTYSWEQTAGPTVSITNANARVATVSNANSTSGTLTFVVTVTDGELTASSESSVTVTAPPAVVTPPPTDNGGGGGGGSSDWLFLLILLLTAGVYQARRQLAVRKY